jgi:hypothetical protein
MWDAGGSKAAFRSEDPWLSAESLLTIDDTVRYHVQPRAAANDFQLQSESS